MLWIRVSGESATIAAAATAFARERSTTTRKGVRAHEEERDGEREGEPGAETSVVTVSTAGQTRLYLKM